MAKPKIFISISNALEWVSLFDELITKVKSIVINIIVLVFVIPDIDGRSLDWLSLLLS